MTELGSAGGLVVANDQRAADAGAAMLRAGGSAVDAAVAAAFALAVTEQHLSGLGGGAWLVGVDGGTGQAFEVTGPITAPRAATPDLFRPLGTDAPTGFYGWPPMQDDENIQGPRSIGVPGAVAALCLAHERRGRLPLPTVLEPAIALAADGHEVDWLASALTTAAAPELARFPATARRFLPGGLPLRGPATGPGQWLRQPELAATLEAVAAGGADAFYRGAPGRAIGDAVAAAGGVLDAADLAGYHARWAEPTQVRLGDVELAGPLYTGFPSTVQMLRSARQASPSASWAQRWAGPMSRAFADRFSSMSTDPDAGTPWQRLLAGGSAGGQDTGDSADTAARSGCTSHLTAVDRDGTVVALTQTVLDLFGSRWLEPATGVLLNDGMLYFDPRPERVNSVRAGLAGLAAVAPTVVRRSGRPVAAVGASGGRRIITAVAQVLDRLLDGADLASAVAAPRLHVESGQAWLDPRLGPGAAEELQALGVSPTVVAELPTTFTYARVNGVAATASGWTASGDDGKPLGLSAG
ncbi:gamma-glutamyltransferase [Nakamurella endophytica]|uniref:Gamma-glutamyltransferase n=1 Tax=Nakamurella endophytica TaxID=1748367 RepID=A0A917SW48_9ACTN|nr:gamma-glutamyltransferase [Nakamurella endophytica]GGL99025.1 gamma-glutamyltransferase [Nakamurella endophytica]